MVSAKKSVSRTAPANSMSMVKRKMDFSSPAIFFIGDWVIVFWIMSRSEMENFPKTRKTKKVEKVMIPNPPNWIKIKIIICPKCVNFVPVSTTVKPVTHVAEVAVNSESINDRRLPFTAWGSISKTVPTNIIVKKLKTKILDEAQVFASFISFFLGDI